MNKIKLFLLIVSLVILLLSRFIFIEKSARFIWDESDDLIRMHNIFVNKKLTMVGPIYNNTKIFGSLTYYMLLPITILFKFDPLGPVIGTAIYSTFMTILFAYILSKKYRWNFSVALIFLTVIFPFIQSGRWAWNPHLVPFWQILSLFVLSLPGNSFLQWLVAGFFLGLSIHNHWYSFFAVVGLTVGFFVLNLKQKKPKLFFSWLIGVVASISPFVIFDLTHPPGLFYTRMRDFSTIVPKNGAFQITVLLQRLFSLPYILTRYLTQNNYFAVVLLILFCVYALWVFLVSKDSFKKILILPVIFQIVGLALIGGGIEEYYLLPAIVYLILFISIPEQNKMLRKYQITLIFFIFIFSIYPSVKEILKNNWNTNIARANSITNIIASDINGERCNLYVAASPDINGTGKKYRDLLSLKNITLKPDYDYGDYKCLYVISTSEVRKVWTDPAYEINLIRNIKPIKTWKISDTGTQWYVYKFSVK
jgi:hypothetical protein